MKSLLVALLLCVSANADVQQITVEKVINDTAVINLGGQKYLVQVGPGCPSIVNLGLEVFLRMNGAISSFDSVILIPNSHEECRITKVESLKPTNTPPATSGNPSSYEQGRVVGQAIGNAMGNAMGNSIYQGRLKRAIGKACYEQGARGWNYADGTTVSCAAWSHSNPREAKGVPPASAASPASIAHYCQATPKARYAVQQGDLWYSYSCQDWKKANQQK